MPTPKRGPCDFTDDGVCAAKTPGACVCSDPGYRAVKETEKAERDAIDAALAQIEAEK